MVYRTDQPVAGSSLRRSQDLLQQNTESINTTYGLDHYPFNDTTANIGLHKQVTNPVQVAAPSTSADQTKLYTLTPHATIGPMQFTRGQSDAVPTPLTNTFGFSANVLPSTVTTIFNFSGTPISMGQVLWQMNYIPGASTELLIASGTWGWDGTRLKVAGALSASTTNLRVTNLAGNTPATDLYWTMNFYRCTT